MNVVSRLVTMIFAIVFLGLGVPFTILGIVSEEGFLYVGPALLFAGLVSGGLFLWMHGKERAARERRRNGTRAKAPIVALKYQPGIQVGSMLAIDLTVSVPAPRGVTQSTRRVLVPPTFAVGPGDEIEIVFDPDDPENFEPAITVDGGLR
jgi:hypothetical protein